MLSQALAVGASGSVQLVIVERRAYPRFAVSLWGVCSLEGGQDIVCSIKDVSLGGLALSSKILAVVGQAASVLLPQIGLVHGHVVRTWIDGFALRFVDSKAQRRRIANYLTWLVADACDPSLEDRAFERIVPLRRLVTLTTSEGSSFMARIIDISRAGVAVTTTAAAAIGDNVRLGGTLAIVARLFDGGFAASFAVPIEGVFDASIRL